MTTTNLHQSRLKQGAIIREFNGRFRIHLDGSEWPVSFVAFVKLKGLLKEVERPSAGRPKIDKLKIWKLK